MPFSTILGIIGFIFLSSVTVSKTTPKILYLFSIKLYYRTNLSICFRIFDSKPKQSINSLTNTKLTNVIKRFLKSIGITSLKLVVDVFLTTQLYLF